MLNNRKLLVATLAVMLVAFFATTFAKNTGTKQSAADAKTKSTDVQPQKARQLPAVDFGQTVEAPKTSDQAPTETINPPTSSGAAANYEIPWQSVNGGGGPASSTNYSINGSVGQSAIGFATSTNYQAGIGYWYGAEATGGGGCSCPNQGDVAPLAGPGDGVVNVLDVVAMIDEVFRSGPTTHTDASCPQPRGDMAPSSSGVQCGDGVKNVLDVVFAIDHVFRSGPAPCDPCNP